MQLGLVHALLTIQGKAPDVVVGVSAGAINAVALAEILQAGTDPQSNPNWANPALRQGLLAQRQRARICRFREIFESYLTAPRELAAAFLPDTLKVDATSPLAPVKLPIHDQLERDGREREVVARQGLIKLFNELLAIRLSFATITRFVRGMLGVIGAGEVRSAPTRWLVIGFEALRAWSLLGVNLVGSAWLSRPLLRPLVSRGVPPPGQGKTAAAIIYARGWVRTAKLMFQQLFSVTILYLLWVTLTLTVLGLPFVLLRAVIKLHQLVGGVLGWLGWHGVSEAARTLDRSYLRGALWLYVVVLAGIVIALLVSGAWHQIVAYNRTSLRATLQDLGRELFRMVPPLGLLVVFPGILATVGVKYFHYDHSWGQEFKDALPILVRVYWDAVLLVAVAAIVLRLKRSKDTYLHRQLARYDLANGILSVHPLKQLFIRLFDPEYYGDRKMDEVVDRALRDDYAPSRQPAGEKLITHYEKNSNAPPITVGLMVANLAGLREAPVGGARSRDIVEVVPPEMKVVDGLLAATAVSPLFPPVAFPHKLFIDGANVAFEGTRALLSLLRGRVNPNSSVIQLYSVASLPFSRPNLPAKRTPEFPEGKPALTLIDVALRALLLQRFRDATLERRLTELFTRVIPPGKAVHPVNGSNFLRIWVTPVEPDQPLALNQRLFGCELDESRRMVAEAVADGCRASLEVMLRAAITSIPNKAVHCRFAVQQHLALRTPPGLALPLLAEAVPGPNDAGLSPGLPEVCRHCKLTESVPNAFRGLPGNPTAVELEERALVIRDWQQLGNSWPHEYEAEQPRAPNSLQEEPHFVRRVPELAEATPAQQAREWPLQRQVAEAGPLAGTERPSVSLLFSGGVFRGVYQVGTLHALSDVGLYPDLIAGASVGSITAAMVAQVFSANAIKTHAARLPAIARIAATYLAIDRLVLTDRFADFIRGLTLRAAATRFSLSQADGFFRRYDRAGSNRFSREARLVTAGLERLFWLSPFELSELVKALRVGKSSRVYELLRAHTQEWLNRMGVGSEALGAEPLALLITEHVLEGIPQPAPGTAVPFGHFLNHAGICFLATTVNLTEGCLEILGSAQLGGAERPTNLLEGLLASSAFPGVFRPRWSWEVMPGANVRHQYIDGGTMDNLPLDAVAHFLRDMSERNRIVARPELPQLGAVPHLLFSASLEVNPDVPTEREVERYGGEWPLVRKRAKQLRYNKKLDRFAESQQALRTIYTGLSPAQQSAVLTPLDLEVVMVRPRWLCSTFGFHPMMGFRRRRQAASIAHGCATALMELGRAHQARPNWAKGWGLALERLPANPPPSDSAPILPRWAQEPDRKARKREHFQESAEKERSGECWYRPGVPCGFSKRVLSEARAGLPAQTIEELAEIHRACGKPETHEPQA